MTYSAVAHVTAGGTIACRAVTAPCMPLHQTAYIIVPPIVAAQLQLQHINCKGAHHSLYVPPTQ